MGCIKSILEEPVGKEEIEMPEERLSQSKKGLADSVGNPIRSSSETTRASESRASESSTKSSESKTDRSAARQNLKSLLHKGGGGGGGGNSDSGGAKLSESSLSRATSFSLTKTSSSTFKVRNARFHWRIRVQ